MLASPFVLPCVRVLSLRVVLVCPFAPTFLRNIQAFSSCAPVLVLVALSTISLVFWGGLDSGRCVFVFFYMLSFMLYALGSLALSDSAARPGLPDRYTSTYACADLLLLRVRGLDIPVVLRICLCLCRFLFCFSVFFCFPFSTWCGVVVELVVSTGLVYSRLE